MSATIWDSNQQRQVEECANILNSKRRPRRLEVTKVSQWDADMLDGEMMDILNSQLKSSFDQFPSFGVAMTNYQPEIAACLRFLVWVFTVRVNKPSPGIHLQNLRFRNENLYNKPHLAGLTKLPNDLPTRGQRLLHGIFTVIVPLVWERLRESALMNHWGESDDSDIRKQVWWLSEKLERAWHAATVANSFAFLYNGKYRNITERVLKMRLVHDRLEAARAVSFEFINQQLLFDGFTEVMMCLLPLIDWGFLRRSRARITVLASVLWIKLKRLSRRGLAAVRRAARRYRRKREGSVDSLDDDEDSSVYSDTSSRAESVALQMRARVNDTCPVCDSEFITMPHKLEECGHLYCYFCIKTLVRSDHDYVRCLHCNEDSYAVYRQ